MMHAPIDHIERVHARLARAVEADPSSLDLLDALQARNAERDFWAYRQFITPKMLRGWWQRELSYHLQKFCHDVIKGKAPKLMLLVPRQHGKSTQVLDAIS